MKKFSEIKLHPQERKAIRAFSHRLKKALGKQLISVLMFGSKVRGESHKESDIDVFILVRRNKTSANDKIARATASVLNDYDILISPVSYDLHEQEINVRMHSFFFENVEREGVPL